MDGPTRASLRRAVSDERRRLLGATLNGDGGADLRAHGNRGGRALALVAWEAADGDPLLALGIALDALIAGRAVPEAA